MLVKTFDELTKEQKQNFYEFCEVQSKTDDPAAVNMAGDSSNSLTYILFNTQRFSNTKGQFYIVYNDTEIVGCSGIYISDFDKRIALAGTRTWISKKYRNKSVNKYYLLPIQKQWAISQGCKQIALCFNQYNKNLIRIFFRNRLGESLDRILVRTPDQMFYSNINELPFSVCIQGTEQWVLYEQLDTNWSFDWSSLKYDNSRIT